MCVVSGLPLDSAMTTNETTRSCRRHRDQLGERRSFSRPGNPCVFAMSFRWRITQRDIATIGGTAHSTQHTAHSTHDSESYRHTVPHCLSRDSRPWGQPLGLRRVTATTKTMSSTTKIAIHRERCAPGGVRFNLGTSIAETKTNTLDVHQNHPHLKKARVSLATASQTTRGIPTW